jgi:hypothetical protein
MKIILVSSELFVVPKREQESITIKNIFASRRWLKKSGGCDEERGRKVVVVLRLNAQTAQRRPVGR